MTRLIHATLTCVALAFLVGCNAAPCARTTESHTGAPASPVAARLSGPASTITLGAGDNLGQQVFARAVTLARAQDPTGWRYAAADSRAGIYPAFPGRGGIDTLGFDADTTRAFRTLLNADARSRPIGDTDAAALTPAAAPSIVVLVPDPE